MNLAEAEALDAADPLAPFRARFRLPEGVTYLDGNSLGPLPHAAAARLRDVAERDWGEGLIRSWNEAGWVDAPVRVGRLIARLVGAAADEVVVADSTSVCLFKLAMAAAELRPGAILAEAETFPTDAYVAARLAELLGRPFRTAPADRLTNALDADVAVAILSHVDYRSAARLDMAALNARAAATGSHIIWDLSHSVGAVPLDLRRDGTELAVGCGYKYLNGGPGAPAFLYVSRALHGRLRPPVAGWWGHAAPFDFAADYHAAAGAAAFLSGTPPILALAALEEGVMLMLEADPALLQAKAVRLWQLFVGEVAAHAPTLRLRSPEDAGARGSHVSLAHPAALAIMRALTAHGVIGDHRPPDLLRFGFAPLYLSHGEVWRAAHLLAEIVASGSFADPRYATGGPVT